MCVCFSLQRNGGFVIESEAWISVWCDVCVCARVCAFRLSVVDAT